MEPEIIEFANSIGANELTEADEIYCLLPSLSHGLNYFKHSSGFLVIKISRSQKPFWGLTKRIMNVFNSHSYHLILLKPASQGWVFSKEETMRYIERRDWNLDSMGLQYKINMPLPDDNIFFGPKGCLKKLARE